MSKLDIPASKAFASLEERLTRHRKMAESYYAAYQERTVEDGASYSEWVFAPPCEVLVPLLR